MLASLDSAVRDLAGARKGEEQKLLTILNQNVEAIADLSWWPRNAAGEQIALLQARVSEQMARVMEMPPHWMKPVFIERLLSWRPKPMSRKRLTVWMLT